MLLIFCIIPSKKYETEQNIVEQQHNKVGIYFSLIFCVKFAKYYVDWHLVVCMDYNEHLTFTKCVYTGIDQKECILEWTSTRLYLRLIGTICQLGLQTFVILFSLLQLCPIEYKLDL